MAHPSPQAVAYICERLSETYFTKETSTIAEQCMKINRSIHHRPLNGTNNDAYQQFALKLIEEMKQMEQRHQDIDYSNEIEELKQQISR
jgi:hypothetical protein